MRVILSLVLSVLAIAGAVLYASELQRQVADENYAEAIIARQLASDMLTRENALHDFLDQARPQTLVSIYTLDRRQDSALARAARLSSDSPEELATIKRQSDAEDRWDAIAQREIDARSAGRAIPRGASLAAREGTLNDFVAANRDYQRALDVRRVEELKAAAIVPVKLIFLLSVAFGAIALGLVVRRRRALGATEAVEAAREDAEHRYADAQARFGEAMQVAEDQAEGHGLLIRHLEAGVPGRVDHGPHPQQQRRPARARRAAPRRSPLADRSSTPSPAAASRSASAAPFDQGASSDEIIACEVCGTQEPSRRASRCSSAARSSARSSSTSQERADRRRAPPHPRLRHPGRAGPGQPAQPLARRAPRRD